MHFEDISKQKLGGHKLGGFTLVPGKYWSKSQKQYIVICGETESENPRGPEHSEIEKQTLICTKLVIW